MKWGFKLKKRFLLVLMLLLFFPIYANAEETTWSGNFETLYDSKGRVVQGLVKGTEDKNKHLTSWDYYTEYNYVVGGGIMYIKCSTSVIGNGQTNYELRVYCVDENNNPLTGHLKSWNLNYYKQNDNLKNDESEDRTFSAGNIYLMDLRDDFSELTQTSIPIFMEDDPDCNNKILNYINNGDYVPDENVPYETPAKQYDESVELPKNLKLSSGYDYNLLARQNLLFPDKDIVLTWDQTQDTSNYSYEIELKYKLDHVTNTSFFGKETTETYNSGYVKVGNGFYDGSNNITHTIGHDKQIEELRSITNNNGWTGSKSYIKNIYIRVRNISGGKCSNWVVVSLDIPNKQANAVVEDDNGNTVQDDNYNNYDAINGDQVNSDNVGSLDDFKKITDFIKNGFGLLGSGGLIGLLSSFFGNIFPQSFWNIITIGMAVVILVGIINFLLKR